MIRFQSVPVQPDLSGALFIPDYQTLLVADLHFEKGSSLARFGVIIPPFDTRSTLDMLEDVVTRLKPKTLISLGDSFHDRDGPQRLGEAERQRIAGLAQRTDILWLTGNHDPELPDDLPGKVAEQISLGPLTLRHEPTLEAQGEICGHLHPAAIIRQRGRKVRRRCFAANRQRLFMPAFGAYTGGLNVTCPAFAPFWGDDDFLVLMIGKKVIHWFPSRVLL
ncbi:MAG TPA: ligase-associated DNA damage response endonuclease PdeM [Rhizobiales bacterium]|nr:ligase-associated DNA damage response endonuclease PdeM [Hyphomicrobiales bacterium]